MRDRAAILQVAFHHRIREATVEAGFERVNALVGEAMTYGAFGDAVRDLVSDGLIRDPVRLPEGALQCHWHLELTPRGVDAVRGTASVPADAKD